MDVDKERERMLLVAFDDGLWGSSSALNFLNQSIFPSVQALSG